MEQRTEEWFKSRLGKVTASRIADVVAKTKTGYSASRENYMAQLVAERLTGQQQDGSTNAAMQWGTEQEPYARMAYEAAYGEIVLETGFAIHPTIKDAGASPDGVIGEDGLAEIKCPNTATHIDYLLRGEVPAKYKPQMAWQLACTGRKWCEFISYDPRMSPELQLFVIRYEPEADYIKELEAEVIAFLDELEATVAKLNQLTLRKAA